MREEHKVGFQWIIGEENGLWDPTGLSSNLHSTIYGLCAPDLGFLASLLYIFHTEWIRRCMQGIWFSTLPPVSFQNGFYCYCNVQSENTVSAVWKIQRSLVIIFAVLQKLEGCIWDIPVNKTDKKENHCSLSNLNGASERIRKHF